MKKLDDIIEKIKKLLEVNRANGATKAEENAAMERANALMTKYQIEEFQVQGSVKTKNTKATMDMNDKCLSFYNLRVAIGRFFGVLSLQSKSTYSFYGKGDNVKMAFDMIRNAQTALSLGFTSYLCSDEYRQNRKHTSRQDVKNSFRDGFYMKIVERLEDLVKQRAADTIKATGTDLVVLNSENLADDFENDEGYELKDASAPRRRYADMMAYSAGEEKGKQFEILKEVENEEN